MPPPGLLRFPETVKEKRTTCKDFKGEVLYSNVSLQSDTEKGTEMPSPFFPKEISPDMKSFRKIEVPSLKPSPPPSDTENCTTPPQAHCTEQLSRPETMAWTVLITEEYFKNTNSSVDIGSDGDFRISLMPPASCRSADEDDQKVWKAFLTIAIAATCNSISNVLLLTGTGQLCLWPGVTTCCHTEPTSVEVESRPFHNFVAWLPYWIIFMTLLHYAAFLLSFVRIYASVTCLRHVAIVISLFCVALACQQYALQVVYTFHSPLVRGWCWQAASMVFLAVSTACHVLAVQHMRLPFTETRYRSRTHQHDLYFSLF